MKISPRVFRIPAIVLAFTGISLFGAPAQPVSPNASPEARALLQLLYDISGKHTLTGQHNYPNIKDRNTQFATSYTGKVPAVFSTDLGHARAGDSDSYLARPEIVQECIRQHQLGALITICWHAVPPTADEPVTFRPLPDSDPKMLKSVQGKLQDEQFRELLSPGTPLYEHWCKQVDTIAVYLKQLQDAHVPVLWRPYHEMNGDWFWWGGRAADTAALYRQIFDRLVNHHRLTNLIWIWSVDRVSRPGMEHEKYFPGIEYVDVLGLDVYGNDFAQSYYDSLEKLSQGKPLTLAEVGNAPAQKIMSDQPKWTFYVIWAGMARNTSQKAFDVLLSDPRFLSLDDVSFANVTAGYRKACGLAPLQIDLATPKFTGVWLLNEEQSQPGRTGISAAPAQLDVSQLGNMLTVRATRILEFAENDIAVQTILLDGTESHSELMHAPRTTTAHLSADQQHLLVESAFSAPGDSGTKFVTKEVWNLSAAGRQLTIVQSTRTPHGETKATLVFDKR